MARQPATEIHLNSETPELSSLNHGDIDDTEIVPGDESDLPPLHDISVGANGDSEPEQIVESTEGHPSSFEVVDEPAIGIANESNTVEPVPSSETQSEWQSPVLEEPVAPLETVSEVFESERVKPQLGGWQRIHNFFFGGSADVTARLNNLTQAIEDAPESAVNYVLRADLYMVLREYALAQADFQRAIDLAETQFELADWGLLDQVTRDRAIAGLEKVQRRLP